MFQNKNDSFYTIRKKRICCHSFIVIFKLLNGSQHESTIKIHNMISIISLQIDKL